MNAEVRDLGLAAEGRRRTEWASRQMPVLRQLAAELARDQTLKGARIAACAHVTSETSALVGALVDAGAWVALCASNPLSTQDDIAAHLVADRGVPVFAVKGDDGAHLARHVGRCLDELEQGNGAVRLRLLMDDGADLSVAVHTGRPALLPKIGGGTEETTTGVLRLRALAAAGRLAYPVVTVNDAQTKHLFDNRYGTGQNTIDGLLRATNVFLPGSHFVVCGFGWCGRGIAARARGMCARVTVCEVHPVRALEAVMEGYEVLPLPEAARKGQIFITATGNRDVIRREHFLEMPDGAILANSGHFDVEIDVSALRALAGEPRRVREYVEEYVLPSGRRLYLLAEGRLVGQAAAEASPAAVMDLSFANQLLAVEHLARRAQDDPLPAGLHPVPPAVDERIARLKLAALGIGIDALTSDQVAYLESWQSGA